MFFFFFSSRRRHTRCSRDWSSDVCSSDLECSVGHLEASGLSRRRGLWQDAPRPPASPAAGPAQPAHAATPRGVDQDRKSTRLNSSHGYISYAVFCLKKKKKT